MKINTNTIITNLEGESYLFPKKNNPKAELTLGDVLFASLNTADEIELQVSWDLLPQLAKKDNEINLTQENINVLIDAVKQAAKRPQRFNLIAYGKVLDILNSVPEKFVRDESEKVEDKKEVVEVDASNENSETEKESETSAKEITGDVA